MTCPCGLDKSYDQCCGALHSGAAAASTAEQLMRSRYSAFAVSDEAYLLRTWHQDTRPSTVDFEPRQRWTGLEILSTTGGGVFHTEGSVEFVARYRVRGRAGELRENSTFVRIDGLWVYVRGTIG
ncbi:YchJ family protein [Allokutzneria albata]|uniref:SEC-C motif-containing protein n=1 Tax=Allokutzneria albata TaxID=211114 RepID=A0A1H0DR57_ALLAB|nr:YchJ family metal-binding protein [Allokutzneria albata]SDN72654.1 SEC-C motif-containing protein [Allokutzneria albata]